jgi:hypothetical protein
MNADVINFQFKLLFLIIILLSMMFVVLIPLQENPATKLESSGQQVKY